MSLATTIEADAINAPDAAWVALSTAEKQSLLDTATVYLNAVYSWKGVIEDVAQLESWPRKCESGTLTDSNGRDITGSIPAAIIQACSKLAAITRTSDILNTSFTSVTSSTSIAGGDLIYERVKADTVETESRYSSSSSSTTTSNTSPLKYTSDGIQRISYIDALLREYVAPASANRVLRY